MAEITTRDIRNIVLVGHSGSGKTTLAEAILFKTGTINKMGSIDEGNTVSDFNADEKDRKISIDLAVTHCNHKGAKINLLDAPGYPDFSSAAISGLGAVDTAIIVINAASGIELTARKMWDIAGKIGLGRAIVVNRMDSENIDVTKLIADLQEDFGRQCIPANLPVGIGSAFKGVENIIEVSDSPQTTEGGSPAKLHEQLVEAVVEVDEELMEKYLEEGEVSKEAINQAIPAAIAQGSLVPVFFTAAASQTGIEELLDSIVACFPSPLLGIKRNLVEEVKTENVVETEVDGKTVKKKEITTETKFTPIEPDNAKMIAQIFKVKVDPFVGKLSFVRVLSGTLTNEGLVRDTKKDKTEKTQNLLLVQGKDTSPCTKLVTGDIGALAKAESLSVNDTICSEDGKHVTVEDIKFPIPMVMLAVEPKSRKDEQRISESLGKLSEEDMTFSTGRDRQTKELVIRGTSQFHLDIMLARLKSRYEVEVTTKQPKVPYLETITAKAEGHHRHKKQTGGRGQFAECYIRIEPRERGEGFEFKNAIFGGSIPSNFVPAIEKGIKEQMGKGVIAGCPFIDVKVEVYDGSFHQVDSDEYSFKIAGARALRDAVSKAKPVLLEPVVMLEVTVPSTYMGDISGDLSSKRGRIMGMDSLGNLQVIKAQVPMSEIGRYSTELRSMTGGEGSYTIEFSHYDIVPSKMTREIVARSKKEEEEE